ncbi:MAG: hypothetical protein ABR600_08390 [Actinomycetota bacterium]
MGRTVGRVSLVLFAAMSIAGAGAPAAQASLWSGTCEMAVTFHFLSPVRASGTAPGYTISLDSSLCYVTLDGVNLYHTTTLDADGTSSTWTCGATVAGGRWDETWHNAAGQSSPAPILGSHFITGTWGAWTLKIQNPSLSFVGVMELTLAPVSAGSLAQCALSGVSTVSTFGVMVFQDP